MAPTMTQEFRKFGETTSVRGIPRAIKHTDKVLRVIWITALIVSLSLTIWQLESVLVKYYRYDTTTNMKQLEGGMIFPGVTICNTSPLGSKENDQLSWEKYISMTTQRQGLYSLVEKEFGGQIDNTTWNDLFDLLQAPLYYFANLPITNDSSNDNFLVDCNYYTWEWDTYENVTCEETITTVYDSNYYHCLQFMVQPQDSRNIRGFTAVFYINDSSTSQVDKFDVSMGVSHATGVQVSVFPLGTSANMKVADTISPGMESAIRMTQTKHQRMPDPYGTCTDQTHIVTLDTTDNEIYTREKCVALCQQQKLIDECQCLDGLLPFTNAQIDKVDGLFCWNQSLLEPNMVTNLSAIVAFLTSALCDMYADQSTEDCECPQPCSEYTYDTSTVTSNWPQKSYKMAFYKRYIQQNLDIFGDQFSVFEQILDGAANMSPTALMASIQATQDIEDNFLQVSVLFDSFSSVRVQDIPAMTSGMLLASIGGTLSLWMGITTMAIIEFIELLYTVLMSYHRSKTETIPGNPLPAAKG